MKLLSWNCQGLGSPLTIRALRALVAQDQPNLIFLMETKNQEHMVQSLRRRMKYPNSFLVNPDGISGGLAFFWDENLTITVDSCSNCLINVQCRLHDKRQLMKITFLHAPNNFNARVLL